MAKTKAGGSAKNLRDSKPKYLGVKIHDGQMAQKGSIIVRQRGTKVLAGKNTKLGKDDTIFAVKDGMVKFGNKRKVGYDGSVKKHKIVNVN